MEIDKICKRISNDLGEDYETVKDIVMHQFLFTIDVMKDEEDYHDVLFNELFRFTLKPRFKEDKTKPYTPK